MKNTRKSAKPVSADAIASQRVNVDVTASMLGELDKAAQDLNVSRQAVIKTLVRQALDQHYLAQRARQPQP
jgi:metal-responsive CopG/Arc/MetJ family transcriptional regulator